MKIRLLFLGVLIVGCGLGATLLVQFPRMRFIGHVIGEDGQPIPGVHATFMLNESTVGFGKKIKAPVTTDNSGNFTVEGYSEDGLSILDQSLSRDGYYESGIPVPNFYTIKDGHWLPWGQTYTTVLRKIGTPVPMYVKRVVVDIPSASGPVGYDLEKGDWVAPYGNGKIADLLVTVTKLQYRSSNDSEVSATVSFSNDGDGIQEVKLPKEFANSMFIWPRQAPETGYQHNLELHRLWLNIHGANAQSITTSNENQAHCFRVRTVKQGDQIVSALYGKIKGGIGIGPGEGKNATINFTYYLNPTTNDRSLEFSGNTLFKNLTLRETTHAL